MRTPALLAETDTKALATPIAGGKIEDTGPLTRKRMETIDEEVTTRTLDFMERAKKADKPFFVWWNSTRMHVNTHLKKESVGKTGLGIYPDGMVEHDGHIGQILDKLKKLGLDENTIIMYSTDNWAEEMSWRVSDAIGRLDEAKQHGWTVVDMKTDWKRNLPFEKS